MATVPHSVEAEEVVVGAVLLATDWIGEASELLAASDFYVPVCREAFAASLTLWAEGHRPDPISVAERMNGDRTAITAQLVGFVGNVPVSRPTAHVATIIDMSQRRRLMESARFAYERLRDGGDTPLILDGLRADIDELGASHTQSDVVASRDFAANDDTGIEWAIPGLIDIDDRVIVVAGEGKGKMVLLRQLAIAAAAGVHPFLFHRVPPINVLYVDLENPEREVRVWLRRLHGLADRATSGDSPNVGLLHRPQGLNLRSRQHRAKLEQACREIQPQLVCIGPLYKSFKADSSRRADDLAEEAAAVFDDLRTRFGFALVIEAHAPLGTPGQRVLRPMGAQLWSAWPDVGVALTELPLEDCDATVPKGSMKVDFFRGTRGERAWPHRLIRGRSDEWPWKGWWRDGEWPNSPTDVVEEEIPF